MAKLINLIDLNEIKTLRITCGNCDSYWSVPVPLGKNKLLEKCNYCETVIPNDRLENIKGLLEKIENIQKFLKDLKVSIELEIEGRKSYAT